MNELCLCRLAVQEFGSTYHILAAVVYFLLTIFICAVLWAAISNAFPATTVAVSSLALLSPPLSYLLYLLFRIYLYNIITTIVIIAYKWQWALNSLQLNSIKKKNKTQNENPTNRQGALLFEVLCLQLLAAVHYHFSKSNAWITIAFECYFKRHHAQANK